MLEINVKITVAEGDAPAPLEQAVLDALSGGVKPAQIETGPTMIERAVEAATEEKPLPAAEEKPAPAKKAPARRAPKKAAPVEDTPMVLEEPAEAPSEAPEEPQEPAAAPAPAKDAEAPSEAPSEDAGEAPSEADLDAAVAKAMEMVAAGKQAAVKKALNGVGARRVSELTQDQVADFMKAVGA